jgi:hypothetical protein
MTEKYYGKYRGTVLNNVDPEQRGRLMLNVPDVLGVIPSSWAEPCVPLAGPTGPPMGVYLVPPIGAGVWVAIRHSTPGARRQSCRSQHRYPVTAAAYGDDQRHAADTRDRGHHLEEHDGRDDRRQRQRHLHIEWQRSNDHDGGSYRNGQQRRVGGGVI